MIIGLSGHIKCGKSTAAKLIQLETNNTFIEKYFAYKLKFIASYLTGEPISNFETQEGKDGYLEEWGMTRRKMLQELGTKSLRNNFHDEVWIKGLFADYKPQCKNYCARMKQADDASCSCEQDCDCMPNWIISDVRFPNEADAIKNRGGQLLRINRPPELIYPHHWNRYLSETNTNVSEKGFHNWLSHGNDKDVELSIMLTHSSETSLDDYDKFDYIVNNQTTYEEYENSLKILIPQLTTI